MHQHPETAQPSSPASVTTGCFDKENALLDHGRLHGERRRRPARREDAHAPPCARRRSSMPTNSQREHASIGRYSGFCSIIALKRRQGPVTALFAGLANLKARIASPACRAFICAVTTCSADALGFGRRMSALAASRKPPSSECSGAGEADRRPRRERCDSCRKAEQ